MGICYLAKVQFLDSEFGSEFGINIMHVVLVYHTYYSYSYLHDLLQI